eukprot:364183-Chlamydomonas_euryale.AAC.4
MPVSLSSSYLTCERRRIARRQLSARLPSAAARVSRVVSMRAWQRASRVCARVPAVPGLFFSSRGSVLMPGCLTPATAGVGLPLRPGPMRFGTRKSDPCSIILRCWRYERGCAGRVATGLPGRVDAAQKPLHCIACGCDSLLKGSPQRRRRRQPRGRTRGARPERTFDPREISTTACNTLGKSSPGDRSCHGWLRRQRRDVEAPIRRGMGGLAVACARARTGGKLALRADPNLALRTWQSPC